MPIVTLNVDKEESATAFRVHKSLLCQASPVFNATFLGGFIENSEQTMSLPTESREVIERFVQWLYTQKLGLSDSSDPATFMKLAELHVFADKYDIKTLKNKVIDEFFDFGKRSDLDPSLDTVVYSYENTNENSSLRRLLAGWYSGNVSLGWYGRPNTRIWLARNPEFAADIAIALAKELESTNPLQGNVFARTRPEDYYQKAKVKKEVPNEAPTPREESST